MFFNVSAYLHFFFFFVNGHRHPRTLPTHQTGRFSFNDTENKEKYTGSIQEAHRKKVGQVYVFEKIDEKNSKKQKKIYSLEQVTNFEYFHELIFSKSVLFNHLSDEYVEVLAS